MCPNKNLNSELRIFYKHTVIELKRHYRICIFFSTENIESEQFEPSDDIAENDEDEIMRERNVYHRQLR